MQSSHLHLSVGQGDWESPTQRPRNTVGERINELKDKSAEITQNKHKEKGNNKCEIAIPFMNNKYVYEKLLNNISH